MTQQQYIQYLRSFDRIGQSQAQLHDAYEQEMQSLYDKLVGDLKTATSGLLQQAGISVLMTNYEKLGSSIQKIAGNALYLDKKFGDLTKTLGVNSKEAVNLGVSISGVSKQFGVGSDAAKQYLIAFQKILPGYSKILTQNEAVATSFAKIQTALRVNAGLSEDAANGISLFIGGAGPEAEEALGRLGQMASQIEQSTGLLGTQRQILQGIAEAGAAAQLQFGRIPGSLEMAVLKSNALGLSIKQLSQTGNTLLSIEQSVGDELEYQLLSGQKLVKNGRSLTNEYRKAFLSGDADKQADILQEIVASQGDVIKNNVLARQSLAKVLGLEENQLAKAVQMEEVRAKVRNKSAKEFQDLFDLDRDEFVAKIQSDPELKEQQKDLLKVYDSTLTENEKIAMTLDNIYTNGVLEILKEMKSPGDLQNMTPLLKATSTVLNNLGEEILPKKSGVTSAIGGVGIASAIFENLPKGLTDNELVKQISERVMKYVEMSPPKTQTNYLGVSSTEPANDFIVTDSGRVIKPHSQDAIMGFKPGGPIDNAFKNQGASIDYNQLAAAVTNAMRNININVNMNAKTLANTIETEISMNQYQRMT